MDKIPYVRISTAYFKIVYVPDIKGGLVQRLIKWDLRTIIRDHGNKYVSKILRYDGSVCIPNHLNFQKSIKGFYNTYFPFSHKPSQGSVTNTLYFFKHIFGSQLELGLDYFKLLYEVPTQALPVLCLVSKERSTGKSSFLKYLKAVFGFNMSFLDSHSLSSQFSSQWSQSLILGVDEAFLQKEEITEKIKYLSTSDKSNLESKGKDSFEVDFFGKFVMCSNKVDSFIKIESLETRFWVRKIPVLKIEDVRFLEKLIAEIPAFLAYILERKFTSERKTRMWFTSKQIWTPALARLMNNNRNRVEKELASILTMVMDTLEVDSLDFIPMDLLQALGKSRVRSDLTQLRKLLKINWKLENQKNSLQYSKFVIWSDGTIGVKEVKGRYFTVTRTFLEDNFDETMTDT